MRATIADRSFDAFVLANSARLLRSAYLLCGDRQDAEDLLQVGLVRVARNWARARDAPDAYTYRTLVNLSRDRHRRTRRRPRTLPLSEANAASDCADPADRAGERAAVMHALAQLPTRQREAVTLRFLADLSVQQAADAMGTSPGSVKTHTSRALTHLRDVLAETSEVRRAH